MARSRAANIHHQLDYPGTAAVLALAVTALILLTSLGGTTYPWASTPIYILGAAGAVLIVAFIFAERRAPSRYCRCTQSWPSTSSTTTPGAASKDTT